MEAFLHLSIVDGQRILTLMLVCMQQDTTAHMTLLVGDLSYADSAEKTSSGHNCTQVPSVWSDSNSTSAHQGRASVDGIHGAS
jgi:hypothetical protein